MNVVKEAFADAYLEYDRVGVDYIRGDDPSGQRLREASRKYLAAQEALKNWSKAQDAAR
jgi:hypothetical protein